MLWLNSPLSVFKRGASAVTEISSVGLPTANPTSMRSVWPTRTVMPRRTYFLNSELVQYRQQEIRHRCPVRCSNMTSALECPERAAGNKDRQWIMVVLVSVGHAAAIENHRVIEQTPVSIRGGFEFVEEVGQGLDVISIYFRKVVHVGPVIRVMRTRVETISNAAGGICRRTEIAGEHHRGNSGDVRFVCQYLKIEH